MVLAYCIYCRVEECILVDGPSLLYNYGVETENLNPQLWFVPWILFNGVSSLYKLFKKHSTPLVKLR